MFRKTGIFTIFNFLGLLSFVFSLVYLANESNKERQKHLQIQEMLLSNDPKQHIKRSLTDQDVDNDRVDEVLSIKKESLHESDRVDEVLSIKKEDALYELETEEEYEYRGWTKARAEGIIETYLKHRRSGMSQEQIRTDVFKREFFNPHDSCCYPFVCGHVFRSYAHMVIEANRTSGKLLRELVDGDVIYVQSRSMIWFKYRWLPFVKTKFVLVTHNSDWQMPSIKTVDVLDNPLLLRWFTVNPNPDYTNHSKVAFLPYSLRCNYQFMGAVDKVLLSGIPPVYSPTRAAQQPTRNTLVYINFFMEGHRFFRKAYADAFRHLGTKAAPTKTLDEFMFAVADSKYVLSPRGMALDCHRHYESILFNAIAIVDPIKSLLMDNVLTKAPTFILKHDWKKHPPSEERLVNYKVDEKLGRSVVLADYWLEQIEQARFER